jgi:hypothetical protein|tara:strand:+ start:51 stop:512 length:462 start_codon:yes stop_codon:yes gene_type:complete
MIEEIYHCKICWSYAKSIARENYEEVFSMAIEKIIVQNPKNVDNFQSYFYRTLKTVYLDYLNQNKNLVFVEDYFEENDMQEDVNNYKLALDLFMSKETTNEEFCFYQDLIYLSFENSKLSLCDKLKLRRADLDIYLAQAYKLIQNEYNSITNT